MQVVIDEKAGFCFGVVNAIQKAEKLLTEGRKIYCLGDIVHNKLEVDRLEKLGMRTITKEEYFQLSDCSVLLRAHGEPPETYTYARENKIELIDGTCPVVLKLQKRVQQGYTDIREENGQLVLLGKKGHAEVCGLNGQTDNQAIIIEDESDLEAIDPNKPTIVFSQTTKSLEDFARLSAKIEERVKAPVTIKDTICRQVANRVPHMQDFAGRFDVILFVAGEKSSNGKALFQVCKATNPRSYFISSADQLNINWIKDFQSIGITGATSTPRWQMDEIATILQKD